MQFSQFKVSAISIAVLAAFTAPLAMAQTVVGDADNYTIQADTDNGGAGEVILESFNGGGTHTTLVVGDNGVSINKALTVTGGITGASVNTGSGSITTTGAVSAGTVTSTTVGATTGNITTVNSTTVNSTTLANTGTATLGTLSVTNNAGVGGTLSVTGATTTNGLANTGAFTQTGITNVTGATNINTSGTATTNIGTAGGATNLGSAASTNTILGTTSATGDTTINGAGTFATQIGGAGASAVTVTSGASSVTTSNTGVSVVGNVSNSLTATTGSNAILANINNTMTATTGSNTIQANITTGVNNIEAKYNNIGVTTGASINAIGNTTVGTTVSSYGGTGYSVLNNTSATFGTNAALNGTTGGMVQTDATTATIRASNSGTLASNGSNGVMAVGAGGGYTAYATAQSTGTGSIGGVVDNKSYTNKISGDTYIDGNVYINGTLDYVSSNSANTSVIGATSATSVLAGATQATTAGTAIVLKGSTGTQTVVDANGKLTNVTGTATESTASLTLTNGVGNTHGLVVTETQSTLSGGVNSSSMTLSDNGATFSDSATGAPVQVHGVNDGTSDFDAVNIRQFAGAIASVTAMANIPQVDQDKTYAVGVGLGNFMGKTALAAGVTYRFTRNGVLKGSISSAMSSSNTTTFGLGAAWSY